MLGNMKKRNAMKIISQRNFLFHSCKNLSATQRTSRSSEADPKVKAFIHDCLAPEIKRLEIGAFRYDDMET